MSVDLTGTLTRCVEHTEACLQKDLSTPGLFITQKHVLRFE